MRKWTKSCPHNTAGSPKGFSDSIAVNVLLVEVRFLANLLLQEYGSLPPSGR